METYELADKSTAISDLTAMSKCSAEYGYLIAWTQKLKVAGKIFSLTKRDSMNDLIKYISYIFTKENKLNI